MATWTIQPSRFENYMYETFAKVVRMAYFDMFSQIVCDTPRDTGQLKNNWMTSINGPITGIRVGGSDYGEDALRLAANMIDNYFPGSAIYLRNNLNYADYIENGTSRIAPRYMMATNVAQWDDYINKAIESIPADIQPDPFDEAGTVWGRWIDASEPLPEGSDPFADAASTVVETGGSGDVPPVDPFGG